jgi:multiple antibiotic resistance protein
METLNTLLTILIPLIIIMDPLGNLLFFLLFTKQNTPAEEGRMAVITSVAACLILFFFAFTGDSVFLFFFAFTGDFVLHYFGIGLPAFQVAGGFIFFVYALQMLHLIPSGLKTTIEEEEEGITKTNAALVPMATPMLAGPGAITAVLVWKLNPDNPVTTPLLLIAITIACFTVFNVFYFGKRISKVLGVGGIRVITRLMGLLLAVIAVQFMINGFKQIQ